MNLKSILFFIVALTSIANLYCDITRRAAFDIGSGNTKLIVADVDDQSGVIVKKIYSDKILVSLKEDMEKGGKQVLSDQIVEKLIEATLILKSKAEEFQPDSYSGIGTEIFRQAKNGQLVIDRVNKTCAIGARIIDQKEEARLGVLTASIYANVPLDKLIAFDIGGASFQIVHAEKDKIHLYLGKLGKVPVKKILIEEIQGKSMSQTLTPNPVSYEEAMATIASIEKRLEPLTKEIKDKLVRPEFTVVGIGAMHHHAVDRLGRNSYTKEDLMTLIENMLGKSGAEIGDDPENASFAISDLLFVYTTMKTFGISKVTYVNTPGNTPAMLISESYWPKKCHLCKPFKRPRSYPKAGQPKAVALSTKA